MAMNFALSIPLLFFILYLSKRSKHWTKNIKRMTSKIQLRVAVSCYYDQTLEFNLNVCHYICVYIQYACIKSHIVWCHRIWCHAYNFVQILYQTNTHTQREGKHWTIRIKKGEQTDIYIYIYTNKWVFMCKSVRERRAKGDDSNL